MKVGGNHIIPDGTLQDGNFLLRGYWEAKDTSDDLDTEIVKKRRKGYPLSNTIFEDTRTEVLDVNEAAYQELCGGCTSRISFSGRRPGSSQPRASPGVEWPRSPSVRRTERADELVDSIVNQETCQRRQSLWDEFRKMLRNHGIEWDKRYVWD
jgi:hypothetical protein